jgi:tetratricopeptide (TPR) repeat protein
MPSHIYSMVGMWEESLASNASALEIQPDYYHAHDFSVYAALQLAQDGKARTLAQQAAATGERGDRPPSLGNFTALAAMPARLVLERGDWAGAAALPVTATRYPQADSLTRFARGLGMARSGNLAGAKGEIEAMEKLRAALQSSDQSYWAARTEEQMQAVAAWIALAEGNRDRGAKLMKDAADSEDGSVKHVAMENRLYPMRELLGDMLLAVDRPAEAFKEYVKAIAQNPNRWRALYGAARAAEAAGDQKSASEYYNKLLTLSQTGDGSRPELERAKAYVTQR